MSVRLTVLGSGSAGNSTLVDFGHARWLIDAGLEPRELERRLQQVGTHWSDLTGVLVTHRHTDHWRPATLVKLSEHRVLLHAHRDHVSAFRVACRGFDEIERSKLLRVYTTNRPISITETWRCRPFRVRHDGGATFGFRFDDEPEPCSAEEPVLQPCPWNGDRQTAGSLAYVADLGCWDDSVATALQGVDFLALEFNHDPALLKASGRPPWLINRVLSDDGHLSNAQAADLLRQALRQSADQRLRQLVLLHLSRECNQPELARAAAQAVLTDHASTAHVFVAEQDQPSPTFVIGESLPASASPRRETLAQTSLF